MKLILQTEASECGLACLAMVGNYYGYNSTLAELRRRFAVSLKGVTLSQLARHARHLGLATRPLRLELEELHQLKLPCILHWDLNHFVVLESVEKPLIGPPVVTILDPAFGSRRLSLNDVSRHFSGVALELVPSASFEKQPERRSISVRELTGKVIGLRRAVVQVIVLALVLEILALVSPLFNQFILDEVLVSYDRSLLKLMAIGFLLVMVTQTAISLCRSWFLMRWGRDVGLQWSTRIFQHLIRLPVSYFEKRHVGDVVSRFGSSGAIQSTLTTLVVESALDGLMAVIALTMCLTYSPLLTLVVVIGLLLYGLLRFVAYQPLKEATQERLILSAKEGSYFLETMRAITPIKLFGRESERISHWLNLKQDVLNRDFKTQKLAIIFKICGAAISGVRSIALLYIGAGLVMESQLSIGMLTAFTSYAGTFSSRIFSLVDVFVDTKMLGMHVERLSDIVLEESEEDSNVRDDMDEIAPSITLRNVRFRYAEGEPWILNNVSIHIPAGQNVALTGPSGCGKSTLCKILLGILKPTEGEVLIGGIAVSSLGASNVRKIVGTVMQDDQLLSGSLMENIAFFDPKIDPSDVERCARLASIHEDIVAMPMGYQTLVGDMGSSLSGGQKQRLFLARALYKKPKILALDEATSHLDLNNERKVNAALSGMKLTRLMVAHRPETIAVAERILKIEAGEVVEVAAPKCEAPEAVMAS